MMERMAEGPMTVARLKALLAPLPDLDADGDPYEVWVETGSCRSSRCELVSALNKDQRGCDVLLAPEEGSWK